MGKSKGAKKATKKGVEESVALNLEDKPIVINLWDGASVKNLLDDAVRQYTLDAAPDYDEQHGDTDKKLACCAMACAFATVAVIYGWLIPHPDSARVVGTCAVMYFVLVSLMTVHAMIFDDMSLLLDAVRTDKETGESWRIEVSTYLPRYDHKYDIMVDHTHYTADGTQVGTKCGEKREILISDFFYEDGEFAVNSAEELVSGIVNSALTKKAE